MGFGGLGEPTQAGPSRRCEAPRTGRRWSPLSHGGARPSSGTSMPRTQARPITRVNRAEDVGPDPRPCRQPGGCPSGRRPSRERCLQTTPMPLRGTPCKRLAVFGVRKPVVSPGGNRRNQPHVDGALEDFAITEQRLERALRNLERLAQLVRIAVAAHAQQEELCQTCTQSPQNGHYVAVRDSGATRICEQL